MTANVFESGRQAGMIERDEVGEQVQLTLAILRGDFSAGHDFQRGANSGTSGNRDAAEGVVIGDGERGQTGAASEIDNLSRCVGAVTVRGEEMQIDAAGVGAARGELTECGERLTGRHVHAVVGGDERKRSRTPLTKAGESAEP